ncbi:MAG: periplasmic heavy metal sensor [Deltaproteobacteria bacterium]|nr:periplasmic heavy metal sensor [Deltaproteobacteria bacterium]
MTSAWWKALIIISLGFNCIIAGAIAYRFLWGRPLDQFFGGPPKGRPSFMNALPPENLAAHELMKEKMRAGRLKINDARSELLQLLAAPAPDRRRISEQITAINALQADMEKMAVEQMLQDVQSLPPDKRQAFLADLERGFFCRRGDGPGMGREGRGRHRQKKIFHP